MEVKCLESIGSKVEDLYGRPNCLVITGRGLLIGALSEKACSRKLALAWSAGYLEVPVVNWCHDVDEVCWVCAGEVL